MNAKASEPARIEEAWVVARLLQATVKELQPTREAFVHPGSLQERLVQEGLTNYVYRIVEELGSLANETKDAYSQLPWAQLRGLRNILAHAYGDVQPAIVWEIIEDHIPEVVAFCELWASDHGLTLPEAGALL